MALYDTDKSSEDRGTPAPNSHDTKIEIPASRTVAGGTAGNIGFGTVIDKNLASGTITAGSVAPAALGGPHAFVSNDGSTGDYTDLQTAINDTFGVGGGIVFIRNGTYLLTASVSIPSNVTVIGETAGGVILDFQNGAFNVNVQGTSPYSTGTIAVNNLSTTVTGTGTAWNSGMIGQSILLSGIWYLIGNVGSATSLTIDIPFELLSITGQTYVIADPVSSATIQNLTIQNSTHASGAFYAQWTVALVVNTINIYNSTIGAQLDGCSVTNFVGSFISSCGTGLVISNSSTWTLYNFEVYASTGDNITADHFYNVSFSNFTNSTAGGNAIVVTNSSNWGLYDFSIQSATGIGIKLTSCTEIEISDGNIMASGSDGLKLVTGNTAISATQIGLLSNTGYGVNIADSSSANNTLNGNYFNGNVAGSVNDSGTTTFKIANTPDSTTVNNTINDTDGTFAANSDSRIATQKATKSYVDAVASGLSPKPSAIVATTTTLPTYTYLSGAITVTATGVQAIDGHNLVLNDIVLIKNETATNQPYNGLYTVTVAGAVGVSLVLTRHTSMDGSTEFSGAYVFVESGTVNAAAGFVCTNTGSVTVGVTNISFTQFSGAGEITAGNGLSKSANTLSIDTTITVDKTTSQVLANKSSSSDFEIQTGHSVVLDNSAGNSQAFLFNNGGSGASIFQTGAPVNFTSDLKVQAPTNVSKSALTTDATQTLTNKDVSSGTNTFPTFNQNTTGSAAKWTTARNLAGNSVDGSAAVAFANKFVVQGTTDSGLSAAQFLGALATGIIKNTTTTGVLSIAANTDLPVGDATHSGAMPTPPNNTTTFLRGDATWATPGGSGNVSGPVSSVNNDIVTFSGTSGTTIQDSGKLLPSGTVVGTSDAQTLSAKILSDAFMGNSFQSQSGLIENIVLTASTDFTYDKVLEIGASNSLEIPATSTLEIDAYVNASDPTLSNKTLCDTFMGQVFDASSKTTRDIVLTANTDFIVPESLEIGSGFVLEIPATSSMEILTYFEPTNPVPVTSISNPYKFSVYRNAALTPGSNAIISFDTKVYDTGNNFDNISTFVFKAPVAGYYHFNAGLTLVYGGAGNLYSIALYVNNSPNTGTQGLQVLSTAAQTIAGKVSGDFKLAAGDTVQVQSLGASTAIITGQQFTYFTGHLISTL